MTYHPEIATDRQALATALSNMLTTAKFVKLASPTPGTEDVYELVVGPKAPGCSVRVFTSIVRGAVRAKDADAIRVAGVYVREDGSTRGITSDARVFRTGEIPAIVDRTLERMRSSYKALATCIRCRHCGAPLFKTKKDTMACADVCWTRTAQVTK